MYIFGGLWAILEFGQTSSNHALKCYIFSNISKFKFQSRFGYPFQRQGWTLIFMRFGLFWPSFKNGQTKVEKMYLFQLFQNWNLKVDLGTHLNKQTCTTIFMKFWAILTPFKSNLSESTWRSFTFGQFLGIEILS